MRVSRCLCAAVLLLAPMRVLAQTAPVHLTLESVLASARAQSPDVLIADARIDESRARLIGASVRSRENPTVDASTGPRRTDRGTSADLDVGFSYPFETGGQRSARIQAAESAIASDTAAAADARRGALEAAALAFFDTAYSEQRVQLLSDVEQTAAETLRIATRRYEAGDIAVLDVNLAKSALARARSGRLAANSDRSLAAARLARVAGLPAGTAVTTDTQLDADRSVDLSRLVAALPQRPDLIALRERIEEALATVRLGQGVRRPDIGLGLRAKREAGDTALVAGFTVTLPTSVSGQEERATGSAVAARVRVELETTQASALRDIESLHAAYVMRREAAGAFEQEALPSAIENEQLAQRSFEEGELSLPDLLVVRREGTETRLEYLERLRDAAETAMMRDAAAGVLR
ncbi:MAG: TolC family protein [Vicinamibacterales bacterium]